MYTAAFTGHQGCTKYSICILFGPNSRPNSVFVLDREVVQK